MSLVKKYLNFNNDTLQGMLNKVDNSIILDNLYEYQDLYKKYQDNPEHVFNILKEKLNESLNKRCDKIFIQNVDINYILNKFYFFENTKFYEKLKNLNIDNLITMMDYNSDIKINYNIIKKHYYLLLNDFINNKIYDLLINEWEKINVESFVKFSNIIYKMSFNDINIEKYKNLIADKFDNTSLVIKLIDYIKQYFIDNKDTSSIVSSEEIIKKYDFRFIIDNMKSNAYLFFEEYYKYVRLKYSNFNGSIIIFPIMELKNDIKLIRYFIFLISIKEKTNINRYVNEILLKIKNYLFDIEDSYNNNYAYYKIKFCGSSDKYKNIDLSLYKRDIATFQILKYNFAPDNLINININSPNLEPYIDMYKSFYSSRYPDRDFEIDFIKSNLIVKITCLDKIYYIHLALLQYVVLDKIMNSGDDGICAKELALALNIKLSLLNDTFNSLLKIKIIKRISDTKFQFNRDFTFDKTKISIYGLIKKEDKTSTKIEREFMHDRSIILLCNLINYAKHNDSFTIDFVQEKLVSRVPFKFTKEELENALKEAIKDNYLIEIKEGSAESPIQYKYEELE